MPRAPGVLGTHASLISRWSRAYFHWMTDALPRLAVLEASGLNAVPLVVPERLNSWQRRSLELAGLGQTLTSYTGSLRPETLVWPRPVAVTGHTPSWACRWLRERLRPTVAAGRDRRLYLTRRRESRRLVNEEAVMRILAPLGFEAVDPGRLSLDEQIQLFSRASVIVGPHGGAFTNVLFAPAATTVIEIFDREFVNPCFYSLAERCGHDYWYVVGASAGRGDLSVELSLLSETLAAAGVGA